MAHQNLLPLPSASATPSRPLSSPTLPRQTPGTTTTTTSTTAPQINNTPNSPHNHSHYQQRNPIINNDLISRVHNSPIVAPESIAALVPGLSIADLQLQADSSFSSDSDFDTTTTTPHQRHRRQQRQQPPRTSAHSRSMSHPLLSFFHHHPKMPSNQSNTCIDQQHHSKNHMTNPIGALELAGASVTQLLHKRVGSDRGNGIAGKGFASGTCMTCSSLVRWPKELDVFKCSICLTINDLARSAPAPAAISESARSRTISQSNNSPQKPGHPRVRTISVEHSKRLINQCLHSFFAKHLPESSSHNHVGQCNKHGDNSSGPQAPHSDSPAQNISGGPMRSNSPSKSGARFIFDQPPTLRSKKKPTTSDLSKLSDPELHSQKPASATNTCASVDQAAHSRSPSQINTEDEHKRVFKPLQDYIVSSFGSFDCVNWSFTSHSPPRTERTSSQPQKRPTITPNSKDAAFLEESAVCDLDPKLLLLGDFAENGLWWTGELEPGATKKHHTSHKNANATTAAATAAAAALPSSAPVSFVTPRSPVMNWSVLEEWYSIVTNVAEPWRHIYENMVQEGTHLELSISELQNLERILLKAQEHVQRLLLKAIEVLLKRPGRPMKNAEDLRFLLIILENPLLCSRPKFFSGVLQPLSNLDNTKPRQPQNSSPLSTGQHSGIIKRVLGLMANSNTDCQHHLTCWFARYPRSRFTQTKDLVSSFLTYRITRQNEKQQEAKVDIIGGLIPTLSTGRSQASLHAAVGNSNQSSKQKEKQPKRVVTPDDWQIKAAAHVMSLIFAANNMENVHRTEGSSTTLVSDSDTTGHAAQRVQTHGQILATSDFYHTMLDFVDNVPDFEAWESKRAKFSFCQYPFLLSIWAKTKILQFDTRRQMANKARDAFFDSIMTRQNVNQFLELSVRRDCLVDDSLKAVSEVIGSGSEDIKKALKIAFKGEEGVDAGGLRKEWFLLLVREVFNSEHGMFLYDEDSHYCYFNPNSFETSDQFFLVGVVVGLAIYNSTILDVALPPFAFRKLLAAAPSPASGAVAHPRPVMNYTLEDLEEYRPRLARGLRQLLDFDGDVESTFGLFFCVDVEKYGTVTQVPLRAGGENKAVTNHNRKEYVDLYIRYALQGSVVRQFEPFKRGFYTVCGGSAFSLFRPEEIELLVRGSDESLDIAALRAVAVYENWKSPKPDDGVTEATITWFWETFQDASLQDQRKLLLFITGSDRVLAAGAAQMPIKITCFGDDSGRYPTARTCFNLLVLWRYESRERLEKMLWTAVRESEGFGLK